MNSQPVHPAESSYDAVPYYAQAYPFTHPRRLEAMATLFGMEPPEITQCRILELGCAAGANLIPQALDLPGSSLLGIDLSARQIRQGQEMIRTLDLDNVELRHANILDVDSSWGQFDYIIAHGVFSWIPAEVQDKLLQLSAENLSPHGVAFISYNTYPGWHLAEIVRGLMRYHSAQFEDAQTQIAEAKGLLKFMVDLSNENQVMGMLLKQELNMLRIVNNDAYLFHEHLEADNTPLYFHEFARRAEACGLQYLGDVQFSTMLLRNLPEEAQQVFSRLPVVRQEQYMDFIRGRRFRKTLLCHRDVPLQRSIRPGMMQKFHFAMGGRVQTVDVDIRSDAPAQFILNGKQLNTDDRLTKAALMYLKEVFPRYIAFEELCATAMARVGQSLSGGSNDQATAAAMLANNLLMAFCIDLIEIAVHPPQCATRVSSRPMTSPLARLQAARGTSITNLHHAPVELDAFRRRLVCQLDGVHQRSDLFPYVEEAIEAGEVTVKQQDGSPTKKASPATLSIILDQALSGLCESALFVD